MSLLCYFERIKILDNFGKMLKQLLTIGLLMLFTSMRGLTLL